jgi:hypothetical protein
MPRNPNLPKGSPVWKAEYQKQLERGDEKGQLVRQKARREYDAAGIDRTGKDIDHKKKVAQGGTSARSNLRLRSVKANRSDNLHNKGEKK